MSRARTARSRSREGDRFDPVAAGPTGPAILGTQERPAEDAWDQLYTFRTYVIDEVNEEASPEDALTAYSSYVRNFRRQFSKRLFKHLAASLLASLRERYEPSLIPLQQAEDHEHASAMQTEICQKLLSLTEPVLIEPEFERRRTVEELKAPFRVPAPATQPQEVLSGAFAGMADPDLLCLCLLHMPATLTKWDLKAHVEKAGASDGLVSVTCTESTVGSRPTLSLKSPQQTRVAWLQYATKETCAAAELKLEGSVCGRFICRPQKRIPRPAGYTYCVLPAEASHPARILRDLRLSARLILKFDVLTKIFPPGSKNEEEANPEIHKAFSAPENEFYTYCAEHPLLQYLQQTVTGDISAAELQLDRQILYLMLIHKIVYYAGRRFSSMRELWQTVGLQMVRGRGVSTAVLSLPNFGNGHAWDATYISAADLITKSELNDMKEADTEMVPVSNQESGLSGQIEPSTGAETDVKTGAEPANAAGTADTGDAGDAVDGSPDELDKLISEEAAATTNFMIPLQLLGEAAKNSDRADDPLKAEIKPEPSNDVTGVEFVGDSGLSPGVIKTDIADASGGRFSRWCIELDKRIRFLLFGSYWDVQPITENSPQFEAAWEKHCKNTMFEQEPEKWQCELCRKMFRGAGFVVKHLRNKHFATEGPKVIKELEQAIMWKCFCEDLDRPFIKSPPPTPYLFKTSLPRRKVPGGRAGDSPQMRPAYPRPFHDFDAPPVPVSVFEQRGALREVVQYGDL